jgi:hypothetical protein
MSTDLKTMLAEIKRAIENDEFNLTKWEGEFLESVTELINFELTLSDNQDETFEKIWRKVTGQDDGDDPDEDDFM